MERFGADFRSTNELVGAVETDFKLDQQTMIMQKTNNLFT